MLTLFRNRVRSDDPALTGPVLTEPVTETDPTRIMGRIYRAYFDVVYDQREQALASAMNREDKTEHAVARYTCRRGVIDAFCGHTITTDELDVLTAANTTWNELLAVAATSAQAKTDKARRTGVAAADAAIDACLAIALRDRIGDLPGWDQQAYDVITRPWRAVVGQLHPDDAAPRTTRA